MNIQTAISRCIEDLALANNTARVYKNGLDRFVEYLSSQKITVDQSADVLEVGNFISFMSWLNGRYSKQTTGVYNASAKALLDYLVIENVIQISYADGIRFKKASVRSNRRHEDKLPRWPQKDDVSKMLEAAKRQNADTPIKERDIALVELLASSGCRINEIIQLNVQDIDLDNRSVIVTGKGSKERKVFFSQAAALALVNYWDARKSKMATDPIFGRHDRGAGHKRIKRMTTTTARNIVNTIAQIAGIDPTKFSPHYFRHAFAIRVLNETGNLALAQDLLGHDDPKSTRTYAKIDPEDLRDAHHSIFK